MFRVKDARDLAHSLEETLRTVRELELHLNFFNLVFANALWGFKLMFLTYTILDGFSAIRIIHTNLLMGVLYIYLGFSAIVGYLGMFQFGYKVEEKFEDLKRMLEIKSMFLVNPVERKYWAGVLKSIPRMGIRLGGFNRVEREAVPVYIDFSICQIVDLLLAFK